MNQTNKSLWHDTLDLVATAIVVALGIFVVVAAVMATIQEWPRSIVPWLCLLGLFVLFWAFERVFGR